MLWITRSSSIIHRIIAVSTTIIQSNKKLLFSGFMISLDRFQLLLFDEKAS